MYFPELPEADVDVPESAAFPLLFLFGFFVFTREVSEKIPSRNIWAPSESRTTLSVKASKRFLVETGAGDSEYTPGLGVMLRRPGGAIGAPPPAGGHGGVLGGGHAG